MKGSTEELVDFVTGIAFEDLPQAVVHEAKRALLDSLGCALGGLTTDKGRLAVELARRLGGPAEATIIGVGERVSCCAAGFANGELINALDYDALLIPSHVSPFVIPAPLALAERVGASGKHLILATAIGHEVSRRLGEALRGQRMFAREGGVEGIVIAPVHGLAGPCIFGGTAAAGKILNLNREKMSHALGLAGHICPVPAMRKWAQTTPVAMDKYLLGGWMAEGEITSAMLAEIGYTGDTTVLDGDYGFWRFYASDKWRPDRLTEGLGEEWRFLDIAYKPYPCCGCMHTGLDCFIHLINENSLMPEEMERVRVLLDPLVDLPPWRNNELRGHGDAQFSVAYVFAVAAHRVPIGAQWQSSETMRNPEIRQFMKKVSFDPHPGFNRTMLKDVGSSLARVEVVARGKTFQEERTHARGSPASEATKMKDEELVAKFRSNASPVCPADKREKAIETLLKLEKIESIAELLKSLVK